MPTTEDIDLIRRIRAGSYGDLGWARNQLLRMNRKDLMVDLESLWKPQDQPAQTSPAAPATASTQAPAVTAPVAAQQAVTPSAPVQAAYSGPNSDIITKLKTAIDKSPNFIENSGGTEYSQNLIDSFQKAAQVGVGRTDLEQQVNSVVYALNNDKPVTSNRAGSPIDNPSAWSAASINDSVDALINLRRIPEQNFTETQAADTQRASQNQQLEAARNRAETQIFGAPGATLEQALSSPTSELGQLSNILRQQQKAVFRDQLAPEIEQALGPIGLTDSGAQLAMKSKALAGLESQRQATLLEQALGQREQIRGMGRSDLLGSIGSEQQAGANTAELQRASITMQFQRELERERNNLQRELAQYARQSSVSRGPSGLQQALGGLGAAASVIGVPFTGGASLAALPGFLGYGFGQEAGLLGQAGLALGQSASSFSNPFSSSRSSSNMGRYNPVGGFRKTDLFSYGSGEYNYQPRR